MPTENKNVYTLGIGQREATQRQSIKAPKNEQEREMKIHTANTYSHHCLWPTTNSAVPFNVK